MESNSSHVPYVEYDGEYLYEIPNKATFSNPDVAYYTVEPNYFEPEVEYIVERQSNTKENQPKRSTDTEKGFQSRKKVIQDVYDENGYTLARPYSNAVEETNVPRNIATQKNSNQTEGSRKKKIVLIVVGIIFCCIIGGVVAGISIFALGNTLCTKNFNIYIIFLQSYPRR